ncbi:uncharacterized protein LOC112516345 [Cynara cardunculus var. scolymus]|uniref:Zinc finger, RING/FYVE/PHD-type n=1 Tax=Cynara cardunculus var. scolymus TaxID=59895 RepID=A0A103XMA0_CYNCS|nr:uncharacterized protein LOC112516345 [Cynara cardunculus var. scolymus]KVH93089.1 Zinc finger, RING/FYVE/PHD-type [Cynara cardunculus var. scolymus]
MEGGDRRRWRSWKSLKRRLGWNRIMGFCGTSNWVFDIDAGERPLMTSSDQSPAAFEMINPLPASYIPTTTMNLATALAADRWQINVGPRDGTTMKPLKSLVRLFEGIDGGDVKEAADDDDDDDGNSAVGTLCCLCIERNKGAALIPCGHTYCRVCSRAMWSKQGSCPLCNRSITEILEIF